MLIMSSIVMVFGVAMNYLFWTKDWWHPPTITGTVLGIEDFLVGFGIGGITAVIYEELFKKKLSFSKKKHFSLGYAMLFTCIFIIVNIVSFYIMQFSSSISWVLSTVIPILFIYILRPTLIFNSFATGIILVILGFIGYHIFDIIQPGFLYSWFNFEKLTGVVIFKVPLEDIAWFMTFGMFIGPLYEFLLDVKVKPKN